MQCIPAESACRTRYGKPRSELYNATKDVIHEGSLSSDIETLAMLRGLTRGELVIDVFLFWESDPVEGIGKCVANAYSVSGGHPARDDRITVVSVGSQIHEEIRYRQCREAPADTRLRHDVSESAFPSRKFNDIPILELLAGDFRDRHPDDQSETGRWERVAQGIQRGGGKDEISNAIEFQDRHRPNIGS